MKYSQLYTASILVMLLFAAMSIEAQQNKAVLYLEKINRPMNAIMVDTWDYTSELAHGKNARTAEARRKELLRTSKSAIDKVSKMEGFNGSTQYRDSVLSYLQINYIVLNEDYSKILNLEEIAEQSYDMMEAYLLAQEMANDKLEIAGERMEEQQKVFAAANNINLLETKDKVAKKLEKAGEVIKYYNVIYLIVFKCEKQEAYLIDAMIKKDFNAMEQNKNALAEVSDNGLVKLGSLLPYKRDRSLVSSSKSLLQFYSMEASQKIGTIIEYFLQKEKSEKIMTTLEAKPAADRTQEDIRQYNELVKDYNRKLAEFNRLNEDLNKSRTIELKNWDNSVRNFLDSHIPRKK